VEFWLESIRARAKNAPIILLGSHADDPKCTAEYMDSYVRDMVEKYRERCPNIKAVITADVTQNVSEVKNAIQNVIVTSQHHMGELVPQTYLELEKLIGQEKQHRKPPIMYWQEFAKLAWAANLKEEESIKRATQFFHDLGTIVHFDDAKSGLNDLVILVRIVPSLMFDV